LGNFTVNIPSGKFSGSPLAHGVGSFPRRDRGRVLRENPNHASSLPNIGRKELIRETQRIALLDSLKAVAEQQDTTERAVESQRNGESAMGLQAAVNMARNNPRARAEFAKLFGIPCYFNDPDFMEAWERFGEFFMRQQVLEAAAQPVEYDGNVVDLFGGDDGR
jgi:hypothetical protein